MNAVYFIFSCVTLARESFEGKTKLLLKIFQPLLRRCLTKLDTAMKFKRAFRSKFTLAIY